MRRVYFIVSFIFVFLLSYGGYQYLSFHDGKLHVVFCNVGQGDGIFIKTPGGSTILVDGGPDSSIINCLNRHIPFWQRSISLVMLTHPHADHLQGLLYLFDRYKVGNFVTEDLRNTTYGYTELMRKVGEHSVPIKLVLAGDGLRIGKVAITIVGPTAGFLHSTSPDGIIGENKEFASLETLISFGKFSTLLTGDSQAAELADSLGNESSLQSVSVLQVPHHGSYSGLSRELLGILRPSLSVISVGKNNRYGHPNPFTLVLLKESNIPIKRTDQDGDVEIVSDGDSWKVE